VWWVCTVHGSDLRRPESRAVHQGKVTHSLWHETGNTLRSRDGAEVSFASRPAGDVVNTKIIDLWTLGGVVNAELLLARSTIQYFKHIYLAMGDHADQNERIAVLISNDDDEEVVVFAELHTSFKITIPDLVEGEVHPSLCELCLVQYFKPVYEINLKKGHRHAGDLKKAKDRLKSPLNKKDKKMYVTFVTANGNPDYHLVLVSSVVRRARFWQDTTQTGVFPCFYADI
jgi:hypothetical protein